jgi:hypothetical protein
MRGKSWATTASGFVLLWGLFSGGWGGVYRGNDTGGIIPWSPQNEAHAVEIAAQHCSWWNKVGRVTDGVRSPGHFINFVCFHDYGQRYWGRRTHFWPPQPRDW